VSPGTTKRHLGFFIDTGRGWESVTRSRFQSVVAVSQR